MLRQIIYRIHADAIDTHLKVKVITRGAACRTYIRDRLTLCYTLTFIHVKIACVGIYCYNAVVMFDHYAVSVIAVPSSNDDGSVLCRVYRRSVIRCDIQTLMSVISAVT